MTTHIHTIVDGSSKFDLMLAVFDRTTPSIRSVKIAVKDGSRFELFVNSVAAIGVSGEYWQLEGRAFLILETSSNVPSLPQNFRAQYYTNNRKGTLHVDVD
jgi:hypothetical protein